MSKKITTKQLLANMNNFIGKDVLLLDGHPHANEKGRTVKAEVPKGLSRPAMLVRLESGEECYVFEPSQLMFITNVIPVTK
jgi:hypothetical protein